MKNIQTNKKAYNWMPRRKSHFAALVFLFLVLLFIIFYFLLKNKAL